MLPIPPRSTKPRISKELYIWRRTGPMTKANIEQKQQDNYDNWILRWLHVKYKRSTSERRLRTNITTRDRKLLLVEYLPRALRFISRVVTARPGRLINIPEVWLPGFWKTIVIYWSPELEPAHYGLLSCQDAATRTPVFSKMMKNGLDPTETSADVERASLAAQSGEKINHLMHITPSENDFENYGNDADVVMNIARSEIKGLESEEADRVYAGRTPLEVRTQIEETLFNILYLDNSGALNVTRKWFVRLQGTIVLSRSAARLLKTICLNVSNDRRSGINSWLLF